MNQSRPELLLLKVGIIWLTGTFVLFLLVGDVARVPDMFKLVIFVTATIGAFGAGFWLRISRRPLPPTLAANQDDGHTIRKWVIVSGLYVGIFGLVQLHVVDASGAEEVFRSIMSPGDAYFSRLRAEHLQQKNLAIQLLTITAALGAPVVPFTVLFWERLTLGARLVAITGVGLQCSYWLFIGTQKGIGDIAIYATVALLASAAITGKRLGSRTKIWLALIMVLFAVYMVLNQTDRLQSQNTTAGMQPNPIVAAVAGDSLGRGVTTTLFYPTHGYLGLAYNLESPFVWTHGLGFSRALDSYWAQYAGGQSAYHETYPVRTERLTGWPADTYWSTIYPWLASDLTWPGAIVLMGLVGFLLARLWIETIYQRSRLSLLLLCQFGILIAYIPANNQMVLTRSGLITFVTLGALYILKAMHRPLRQPALIRARKGTRKTFAHLRS